MTERDIFLQALDQPEAIARAVFLDQACAGDADLRKRVEALLAGHEASGLLDRPAIDQERTIDSEPQRERSAETGEFTPQPDEDTGAGRRLGGFSPIVAKGSVLAERYTLVEKIGEGGMGEVWVAQQTEPVKRKVALKLVKTGMDSRAVLARFEQERQALALMDHPHIARVLDGGLTPTGQPFFVMELVNGLSLTKYCDEMKLSPRERLELFVPICQAVQHAHQKGIVHRDLKPANILVTLVDGRAVPKVIDFGVAKAIAGKLTEETLSTQFGAVVGTLEYMAPEQAAFSGVDIDTRADIYSLGVILYELLTGLRPIDSQRLKSAALAEMIRLIQEDEPSKPSTRLSTNEALPSLAALRRMEPKKLMALLRGELDWVVMKCLEKQRDRRYETANALARDVQRYLADEPVEARPPSLRYRLRKGLRRHRAATVTIGLVAGSLLLGTVISIRQAIRATQAEELERSAKLNAEKLADANAALAAAEEKQRKEAETAREKAQTLAETNLRLAGEERRAKEESERRLRLARANLFTTQMARVAAVRETEPAAALQLLYDLEACPIDLRDAAWNFSAWMCNRQSVSTFRQPQPADLIEISPEGLILATARTEFVRVPFDPNKFVPGKPPPRPKQVGHVLLREISTGNIRAALPPITGGVVALAFSPDDRILALAGGIGPHSAFEKVPVPQKVRLWDVASGKETDPLQGHADLVLSLAFSTDGSLIATGSKDGTARIWETRTRKLLQTFTGHEKGITAVAFSPDGKRLATGGLDNTIRLWETAGGKPLATLQAARNKDPNFLSFFKVFGAKGGVGAAGDYRGLFINGVISLAFSPDGGTLLSGNADWQIENWDPASGRSRWTRGEGRPIRALRFHPDGRSFFSSDGSTVKRWDAETGRPLLTLAEAGAMSMNRAGTLLATGHVGRIEILKVDAPPELATFTQEGVKGSATRALFSGTGEVLAVACGEKIYLWDVRSGKLRHTLEGHGQPILGLALAPDGHTLASSSGHLLGGFDPDEQPAKDQVRLWNILTGASLGTISTGEGRVPDVAFSPDGLTLATLCDRRDEDTGKRMVRVKLSDLKTRTVRFQFPEQEMIGILSPTIEPKLTFSPDGKVLATGILRDIDLWDVREGKRLRNISIAGGLSGVGALAFTPDGKKLAASVREARNSSLHFWDPITGNQLGSCPGGSTSLEFTPDGRTLLTRGIQFTNVETAQVRDFFQAEGNVLALSRDGRILATADSSSRIINKPTEGRLVVKFWNLGPPKILASFSKGPYTGRFLADGATLAFWARLPQEPVHIWDLAPLRPRVELGTSTDAFSKAFSPDGRILALGGSAGTERDRLPIGLQSGKSPGLVGLWDTRTGKNLKSFEVGRGMILSMAFSQDGKTLALVHTVLDPKTRKDVGTIDLLDLEAGKVVSTFPRPENHGRECAFGPDGKMLALGCEDGSIVLRDLKEGTAHKVLKGASGMVAALWFTQDGNRLVSQHPIGSRETAIWDWRSGKLVEEPLPFDPNGPISPDGRFQLERGTTSLHLLDRTWRAPVVGSGSDRR